MRSIRMSALMMKYIKIVTLYITKNAGMIYCKSGRDLEKRVVSHSYFFIRNTYILLGRVL